MNKWEKLIGRLKNSPKAISSTFSNPRAKIGMWTTKGKEAYGQVIKHLPVMRGSFGEISVWRWIIILILFVLSIITLMGYLAVQWVKTNGPKLVKFDNLENWELQTATAFAIAIVIGAYLTRKKKPRVIVTAVQPAPAASVQANITSTHPPPKKKEEVGENSSLSGWGFVGILLMFVSLHALGYYALGQWWIDNIWDNPASWFAQFVLLIAVLNLPKGKVPPNQRMAQLAIGLVLLVFLPYQACNNAGSKGSSSRASTSIPGQKVYARFNNFFIPMGTPACFKERLGPDKDAAYAVFPGQMDLVAVFCRESRFNQFDSDGKTPLTGKNSDGTVDTGIAQINSVHDAELTKLGLDKNKLEDNLKYAGILYEKNGLADWTPPIGKKLVFEVEVSDEWSATFKMPQIDPSKRPFNYGLTWNNPVVVAIDDESRIVTPSNGENLGYPKKNYKFKSEKPGKKALVTVTYQY